MTGDLRLLHGDALDLLRADALGYPHALGYHPDRLIPDASIDAIVTDPPYGLADHAPATVTAALAAWLTGDREHVPDGRGFMGREWDGFVPPPAVWDECLRVLKPGGLLLAFAGSRTADLMGISVRLAGFEIRDGIDWLYGSGFPKSLDVSKAIDKANGRRFEDRYALGRHLRERREAAGLTRAEVNGWFGYRDGCEHWERQDPAGARVPTLADWRVLRERLGLSDEFADLVERAEAEREVVGTRPAPGGQWTAEGRRRAGAGGYDINVTAPATDDAARWSGWGTALKPAREPIVVARKPLAGTVAANVLEHRTGALNIDACRVPHASETDRRESETKNAHGNFGSAPRRNSVYGADDRRSDYNGSAGRWPSNVVLSHVPLLDDAGEPVGDACAGGCVPGCPVAELDAQSGASVSVQGTKRGGGRTAESDYRMRDQGRGRGFGDTGGASRFFPVFRYQAKAPARERPKVAGVAHPTVKPLALMRWLVRLVCPPGGTVLDLFAGSGTTGEACLAEGFPCLLFEREADYLPLIAAREARTAQAVLI